LVLLSGAIFVVRGAFVLGGMKWPQAMAVKWLSYAVDTALLTAALMLLTILPWAMFGNGWLLAKLALLVAYVVLGVLALRRGRTLPFGTPRRRACGVSASVPLRCGRLGGAGVLGCVGVRCRVRPPRAPGARASAAPLPSASLPHLAASPLPTAPAVADHCVVE